MDISQYTKRKLEIFDQFIKSAVQSSARAILKSSTEPWRRVPGTIYLFDIGCADGAGSTALLVEAAEKAVAQFPVNYQIIGFEKDRQRASAATDLYTDNPNITIYQGDAQSNLATVLASVPSNAFGLSVIDLWYYPCWSVMTQLSAHLQTVDQLVLCCAGGYKRHPDQNQTWHQARIPRENIDRVNKKHKLIGRPWGPSQFVEMYFTNYPLLGSERKSLGIVALESEVGQRRWEELHIVQQPGVRKQERVQRLIAQERQLPLF